MPVFDVSAGENAVEALAEKNHRLTFALNREQDAHKVTRAERDELRQREAESNVKPKPQIQMRNCSSCGDILPDGPAFFPGYLSDGSPECVTCFN